MTETNYLRIKNIFLYLFCVTSLLLLFSCENKTPDPRIGLLSEFDSLSIGYTDTLSINSKSQMLDSIATGNSSFGVLGSFTDENFFGQVTADFAFEFSPFYDDTIAISEDSLKIGSTYLNLIFADKYGDTNAVHNIKVYELTDTLPDKDVLYSNSKLSYNPTPLADTNITFNNSFSDIYLYGDISARLVDFHKNNKDAIKKYITEKDTTEKNNIKEGLRKIFKSEFKGLYIKTTPNSYSGAIVTTSLIYNSSLKLNSFIRQNYYKEDTVTPIKFLDFSVINESDNRVNILYQDKAKTENLIEIHRDSLDFVQGMLGPRVNLTIPGLSPLQQVFNNNNINVTVTLAELYVPITTLTDKTIGELPIPPYVYIVEDLGNGDEDYITDILLDLENNYNHIFSKGKYNADYEAYVLNVTREINEILQGNKNITSFNLYSSSNGYSMQKYLPYRVMLKNQYKLKVYYTTSN